MGCALLGEGGALVGASVFDCSAVVVGLRNTSQPPHTTAAMHGGDEHRRRRLGRGTSGCGRYWAPPCQGRVNRDRLGPAEFIGLLGQRVRHRKDVGRKRIVFRCNLSGVVPPGFFGLMRYELVDDRRAREQPQRCRSARDPGRPPPGSAQLPARGRTTRRCRPGRTTCNRSLGQARRPAGPLHPGAACDVRSARSAARRRARRSISRFTRPMRTSLTGREARRVRRHKKT